MTTPEDVTPLPEHTPLPWHSEVGKFEPVISIIGADVLVAALSNRYPERLDNNAANAAYIVKAANAYPLAETLAFHLEALLGRMQSLAQDDAHVFQPAEEALAAWKAE